MFWFRSRAERPTSVADGGGAAAQDPSLELLPPPLPEVVEGNEDSDWALWEASVAAMDEHVQALMADAAAGSRRGGPRADSAAG